MKTFKEFIKEEGYDVARDQGKVRPSKDKKDATTMSPSKEMKRIQKVNKGPSALERVKKDIRKRGEKIIGEAKYEAGASTYGKATIRNKRKFGKAGDLPDVMTGKKINPTDETRGELILKRREEHKAKRGMKESMSGGVPMTPQELNIQKKMSQLNVRLARKRSQQLQKAKVQDTETSPEQVKEEGLRDWFGKSKSKGGKGGWVNVVTGGTCASDKPGEGTPKCVSSSKRASMSKAERLSAARRKKKADPGQQSKSGAAKPTYVRTDSPRKKK